MFVALTILFFLVALAYVPLRTRLRQGKIYGVLGGIASLSSFLPVFRPALSRSPSEYHSLCSVVIDN
jgi:hypothetical protein